MALTSDRYRDIIGVAEGTKEDRERWRNFLQYLKTLGINELNEERMFILDKRLGLVESIAKF